MKNPFESTRAYLPSSRNFSCLDQKRSYRPGESKPFALERTSYTNRVRTIALTFFMVGLVAISSALSFEIWQTNPLATAENAVLELAQGCFLLLASLIQAVRALDTKGLDLKRDIRFGLALLAFALFLREVDIDKLGDAAVWGAVETLVRAAVVLMLCSFLFRLAPRMKQVGANISKILFAPTVIVTMCGCALYAGGWPFDREVFNLESGLSLWFEETFELNASLLLLCASLMSNIKTDD